MNSVPLIQKVDKDSINTTIIALKKAINEIESVLGLDSGSDIDTSVFVKKSEVVDAVEADNLNPVTSNAVAEYTVDRIEVNNSQPVTSNAVAETVSLKDTEVITGGIWNINGVDNVIKKKVYRYEVASITTTGIALENNFEISILDIISLKATIVSPTTNIITNAYCYIYNGTLYIYEQTYNPISNAVVYVFVEYV